eukprot:gene5936-9766_t
MSKLTRADHEKILKDLENHPNKSRVKDILSSHSELRNQLKELQELSENKNIDQLKEKWIIHKKDALKHSKIEDKVIYVDLYFYYQERIPNEGKGMKFIDEQHAHIHQTIADIDESLSKDDIEKVQTLIDGYCKEQMDHMNEEEVLLIPVFLNLSFYEYSCYVAGVGYKFMTGAAK